jgi:3'(2'), 5'-bisphosphate nucleotidase
MAYDAELQAALDAARRAGRLILEAYAAFQPIPDARADISTDADRQAQELILTHLHGLFPADALCAEEATPTLAAAPTAGPRRWIVDPIDGTRGFAKKNGEFAVMIAFLEAERVAVGVVLEPARGRLTWAVRGGGCWKADGDGDPQRARVSATAALAAAALTQSHSKSPGQSSRPVQALRPSKVIETYSAGLKLALVARGDADLYVNSYPAFHDWDVCAGQVLVEEAGGRVTGLKGEAIRYGSEGAWQRHGLLASNGALHEAALAELAAPR